MILPGKYYKEGKFWLIEISQLDALTQSTSRSGAFNMIQDWIMTMANCLDLKMEFIDQGAGNFIIKFDNPAPIVSLMLERAKKESGMSLSMLMQALELTSKSVARSRFDCSDKRIGKIAETARVMGYELCLSFVKIPIINSKKYKAKKKSA